MDQCQNQRSCRALQPEHNPGTISGVCLLLVYVSVGLGEWGRDGSHSTYKYIAREKHVARLGVEPYNYTEKYNYA